MILIAILLPALSFLLRGMILHAILCLVLQITLIGWLPAAIWAVVSLNNARADRRADRIVRAMRNMKS
ncbi:YqaE/Pmp3 family membrane protein [Chitinophaga deserti]|uniref:YqaE/Pmp3 family membrane protein n=1 Tax=Chitinophaga deserti TaxID=2164099 RepID=UPI000D6C3BFA|nr:YqaE/Pmp3 family membrane protein [Chitinophaga deserti]